MKITLIQGMFMLASAIKDEKIKGYLDALKRTVSQGWAHYGEILQHQLAANHKLNELYKLNSPFAATCLKNRKNACPN